MKHVFRSILQARVAVIVATLAWFAAAAACRANVSVSNIKLNGSATQASTALGNGVFISYILSDVADLGVSVNIYSNSVLVRTFSVATNALATNGAGLSLGTNLIFWDGKDSSSNTVGIGSYNISVTAASSGHSAWTLLTTNAIKTNLSSGGYYVYAPRGIAVDNNTNSLYYGRVFVAGAGTGYHPNTVAGDRDTILKFNADGAAADDGPFGDGRYPMSDQAFRLPEKLRMGDDNRLYMNDRSSTGQIVAFNEQLTTNSIVLNPNNYFFNPFNFYLTANGNGWFSMDVTASNANSGAIWLGDVDANAGVWFWNMAGGFANPADEQGNWEVAAAVGGPLTQSASGGLMVDSITNVFVSQYVDETNDNSTMLFAGGKGALPKTNAVWSAGAGDATFGDVVDTTIDSRAHPRYVACAMAGPTVGGIRILDAGAGTNVAANLDPANTYWATAWDNVGNLYAASDTLHAWRVWSPRVGTNVSTTFGQASVKTVTALTFLGVTSVNNQIAMTFTATAGTATNAFSLLSSSAVEAAFAPASGYFITNGDLPGLYVAVTTNAGGNQFFLIKH